MLEVQNLTKQYPTPRGDLTVLEGVSFTIGPGEAASVMGPSGSGKSSLLYIIGALEPPTSGAVSLDGADPFALGDAALARFRNSQIGFIFQDHCLLPQCSVLENVLVPAMAGDADAGVEERARELLDTVGLAGRLTHRPAELSGGEKQRVAIARALIRRPRLLLCDEPTGNLDRESADTVADLLTALQRKQGSIMIVVTHSARLGERLPIRYELTGRRLERVQ